MATFEYPSHPMAANDFTLYPYQEQQPQETWNQDEQQLPYSTYQDSNYIAASTLESYQAQPAYITPEPFAYSCEHSLHGPTPSYSPSNSATHSFDNQNLPVLSAPSDSGASAQSTISSAMGSPAMQPLPPNEWAQSQHLSMLPGIFQDESAVFPNGFDYETIPVTNKGCVGELTDVSSSQPQMSRTILSSSASSTPLQPVESRIWPLRTPGLSLSPAFSPCSNIDFTSPSDNVFKSPTTPASATSPSFDLLRSKQLAPFYSDPCDILEVPSRPKAPKPTSSPFFFSHTNGSFVLPLEASYPALIQPYSPAQYTGAQFVEAHHGQSVPYQQQPLPSGNPVRSPRPAHGKAPGSLSPYMRTHSWQPYPQYQNSRRPSVSSMHSKHSQNSQSSEDSNKGLCPIPTCGRHVKDLKAHMLTHQNERPEKCPIPTCEYHIKGFARKYDKNRHTLTHYKGTMVCGFCPGSGSAAEKSFNRADVFKRHLTSVHGVEQTPPNARRKSPASATKKPYTGRDTSGMCSTCNVTFASAQDFYEHLDDCVLRVVQQADPSEAINERLLGSMADNKQVLETMERHLLPTTVDYNAPTSFDQEEEADENDDGDEDEMNDDTYGNRTSKSSKSRKSEGVAHRAKKGLTHSKNGVPLAGPLTAGKGSKRRKNYPLSWGAAPENMRMRKRVLCVYDGQRRLWKDDMMLDAEHEVRIPLPDLDKTTATSMGDRSRCSDLKACRRVTQRHRRRKRAMDRRWLAKFLICEIRNPVAGQPPCRLGSSTSADMHDVPTRNSLHWYGCKGLHAPADHPLLSGLGHFDRTYVAGPAGTLFFTSKPSSTHL
nr:hypothetical protein CFP56_73992 [Quercus suber]